MRSKDGRIQLPDSNNKIEPFARIGDKIEWNEILEKELSKLNLIKEKTGHKPQEQDQIQ